MPRLNNEVSEVSSQSNEFKREESQVSLVNSIGSTQGKVITLGAIIFISIIILVIIFINSSKIVTDESEDFHLFGDEINEPYIFNYSDWEKRELVLRGVSTDDIEYFQSIQRPFYEILDEIQLSIDNYIRDRFIELRDLQIDENTFFNSLYEYTWLNGNPINVEISDYKTHVFRVENIRYIKIPPRGNQLWIRLTLLNGNNIFMSVTPEKYIQLRDDGNMVVKITFVTYNDIEFITEIVELNI